MVQLQKYRNSALFLLARTVKELFDTEKCVTKSRCSRYPFSWDDDKMEFCEPKYIEIDTRLEPQLYFSASISLPLSYGPDRIVDIVNAAFFQLMKYIREGFH